jgi:hypothetical protein
MRKLLWFCASVALCTAVAIYLAADYVNRHPETMFGRCVVTLYRAGTTYNPMIQVTRELAQRTFAAARQQPPKPAAVSAPARQPSPDQVEQVAQACEPWMKTELPSVELLGTIVIPEDGSTSDPMPPFTEPGQGGEEETAWMPMEPLGGDVEPPLTMPYLDKQPSSQVRKLLESNDADVNGGTEECEPEEFGIEIGVQCQPSICNPCPGPCYPHGGCTQPQVCPYSGKCCEPEPKVPHCESDDEHLMKGITGDDVTDDEISKPMPKDEPKEEPKDESNPMDHSCPGMGGEPYHHGNYHQIVCPYTGKCYPADDEPSEPMKTEPEIKAEEQQEATPVQQPKPEKEVKKSRKMRHKLHLLLESDPSPGHSSDTLEFRPSDAVPNQFGLIPF